MFLDVVCQLWHKQRRISPNQILAFFPLMIESPQLISNRTGGRYHVTHGLLCIRFFVFDPLRVKIEIRATLSISGRGRATGTKERLSTPAEIKAAAAPLTPHPPTLALGRWRLVICSLGFSQHTTSPTQQRLLKVLSFNHTGAQEYLGYLLRIVSSSMKSWKKKKLEPSFRWAPRWHQSTIIIGTNPDAWQRSAAAVTLHPGLCRISVVLKENGGASVCVLCGRGWLGRNDDGTRCQYIKKKIKFKKALTRITVRRAGSVDE